MQVRSIALLTTLFSASLLILGAVVHHSGTALDCSTWPLCYVGERNVSLALSNAHRYLGLIVGLLMIALVFKASKIKNNDIYHASLLAFVLIVIQGMLGAVTAIYRLPTLVSTSHFFLSIIFLSVLLFIDHRLVKKSKWPSLKLKWDLTITDRLSVSLFFILSSCLLGAFVRHSDIMGSCGLGLDSALLCRGDWWPTSPQSQVHMFYRYYSFVSWLMASFALLSILKEMKRVGTAQFKGLLIGCALCVSLGQALGLATITYYLNSGWAISHYIANLLTLILFWKLYLSISSLEKYQWGERQYSLARDILSLAKPRLAMLVMLTALVGIILAPAEVNFFRALIGFVGVFLVVGGGCALNCLMEKRVDALMERTKDRPLASGRMDNSTALIFGLTTTAFGIISLLVWVNVMTALLSVLASILYLFAYTPLKQKSVVALYVGAIPGAIPPVMGWTIVMGSMDAMAWFLFGFLFVWQLPHFMAISIYLEGDYSAASIKVYPNSYGLTITRWAIVFLTIVLGVVAYYPVSIGFSTSGAYAIFSTVMLVLFLLLAIKLFLINLNEVERIKYWAKVYFFGSIIYLPLVLGALLFLK